MRLRRGLRTKKRAGCRWCRLPETNLRYTQSCCQCLPSSPKVSRSGLSMFKRCALMLSMTVRTTLGTVVFSTAAFAAVWAKSWVKSASVFIEQSTDEPAAVSCRRRMELLLLQSPLTAQLRGSQGIGNEFVDLRWRKSCMAGLTVGNLPNEPRMPAASARTGKRTAAIQAVFP